MGGLEGEISMLNMQLEDLFQTNSIRVEDVLDMIMKGHIWEAAKVISNQLMGNVYGDLRGYYRFIILLFCLGLISALLMNLTELFETKQVAEIGFYFAYLFLMILLMKAFGMMMDEATKLLELFLTLMKLMMPLYFLAVGAANGVTTGLLYYQMVLFFIFLIETGFTTIILPLIRIYLFLNFMNGIWGDEKLYMLLTLVQRIVGYLLKVSLAAVAGMSFIQSMITPVIDSIKMTSIQKAVACIPGIGEIGDGTAQMMIGSAVLIKNSIGVLALIILVTVCAVPMMKIWILSVLLKLSAAVCGIFGERRLIHCQDRTGEGGLMLFRCMLTSVGLFMITIAIVSITTNRGF